MRVPVVTHFYRQWKGTEPVKVGKVYEIRLPRNMTKAYETYMCDLVLEQRFHPADSLQNPRSKLTTLGIPRQIQTFHSTQCICDLGTTNTRFCTWRSCGICAIIRSAFTAFEFEVKSNSGRRGSGVYSYLEPSLADRHAVSTMSSPYRVMLACEVDLPPPQVQPPKFSGIVQSVSYWAGFLKPRSHTNSLNLQHEEGQLIFVSGAEAIIPKYLILYTKSSTNSPTGSHGRMSMLG